MKRSGRSTTAAHAVSLLVCAAGLLLSACVREGRNAPENQEIGSASFVFHDDPASPEFGAIDLAFDRPLRLDALRDLDARDARWRVLLAVFTGAQTPTDRAVPAVDGRYDVIEHAIRFIPSFPPVAGQPYYARGDLAALSRTLHAADVTHAEQPGDSEPLLTIIDTVLLVPVPGGSPTTTVAAVYPSSDRVPVNLLRLYVHFSAPMSLGFAQQNIRLLDDRGEPVEDAFLHVPQELWDPERTRLTVLFDPGRIKRDLRPNEELGLPLQEGRSYTLVIDAAWPDNSGQPLLRRFEKRFSVGPADRTAPSVDTWSIDAPAADTRVPLIVDFGEPLDRALALRLISVVDPNGATLEGLPAINATETRWMFTPSAPWSAGQFRLAVRSEIEDLAGNNLFGLFDVDMNQPQPTATNAETVSRPFTVAETEG